MLATASWLSFVKEMLAKEEILYPIAPSLPSQYRCRRGIKKNDHLDAANVARGFFHPMLLKVALCVEDIHGVTISSQRRRVRIDGKRTRTWLNMSGISAKSLFGTFNTSVSICFA